MPQLMPMLLLRTDTTSSPLAVALRNGGYLVTKVQDDDAAMQLATTLAVDGVVIDLPSFQAISFTRRFRAVCGDDIMLLIAARAPESIRRLAAGTATVTASPANVVSETDVALARHELQRAAAESHRLQKSG